MFKNVASKFMVFAFDATTNLPKTGDAANITAYVSKDYGSVTVLGDTSATEMDATNAKGYYLFDAAQAETNADCLMVSAKSSTSNIVVVGAPAVLYTRPTTGWLAPTTAGRTLDVSAGGEAGVDWANVGSPTTSLALTGTTIATTQKVDIETIKTQAVTCAGGVTVPAATLASTTNITAGTVTTATNVTTLSSGAIADASFATTAGPLSALGIVDQGTAQSVTGTTIVLRAAAAFADTEIVGATVYIVSATTGAGQSRLITAYVGATDTATVDTWTTTPTGTIVYKIFATAPSSGGGSAPSAATIATAVWQDTTAGDFTVAASVGKSLMNGVALGTGLTIVTVSGNVNGSIGSLAAQAKLDVNAEVDSALDTAIPGTPTAGSVNDVIKDLDARLPGSGTLCILAAADVKTQVVAALNTDTYAEPAQGAPAATTTLAAKINYLYKAWRNKSTQTSTTYSLFADDATTVDHKATCSDDATTGTRGEIAAGP